MIIINLNLDEINNNLTNFRNTRAAQSDMLCESDFLREAIYLLNVEIKKLNSVNKELIERIENIEGALA